MRKLLLTFFAAILCTATMWAAPAVAIKGKLPGAFTINSDGDQVYFSQGNLQYQASTGTWRFAEHQYDYVGNNAGNTAPSGSQTAWIDLFGWATSGKHASNPEGYMPYTTSATSTNYGPAISSGEWTPNNSDWGVVNAISNGGNQAGLWRTPTSGEWLYLLDTRTTSGTVNSITSARYTEAKILTDGSGTDGLTFNICGLILFPDDFDGSASYSGVTWGDINSASAWGTTCTTAGWEALEDVGCVFLPIAGDRLGTLINDVGSSGYYWSSTVKSDVWAYYLSISSGNVNPQAYGVRCFGFSVRLVSETAPSMTDLPLTFEAKEAGATVTYNNYNYPIEYSTDGITWTQSPYVSVTLENVGDKVYFRGNNETYYYPSSYSPLFNCSYDCYIYGNIMSLVHSTNFATATTLSGERTFYQMFKNNTHIKNHPTKDLVLPATTLAEQCYYDMFNSCTGLTKTPELPATTLAKRCYYGMFDYCTGLTTAPELPATTLAEGCYYYMFDDCTGLTSAPELPATTLTKDCYSCMFERCSGLTSAPELPATTLAEGCYLYMFSSCTGLTSAPELPATNLAYGCYSSMFDGCTGLTSAPELPATTLATRCYAYMFEGCTGLTSTPELPATTLANYCYFRMFKNCSNLSSVTCYATITATDATTDWLNGVATSGTFYAPSNKVFKEDERGANGIPENWNIGMAWSSITETPLTFEAKEAGATVTYTTQEGKLIEYSTDGTTWTTYSTAITLANVGDKVYFRGNNENYGTSAKKSQFSCSKDCYIYGNIMSLVDKTNYATTTSLTTDWTFRGMFYENTRIKNHPTKDLVLPATTIAHSCYRELFYGCTGLTRAPQLPATMMKNSCYCQMFRGCTGLTAAPALPATTLSNNCYEAMFKGCTGLTSAPTLPGTFMMSACYYSMFSGCTGLTEAPALPATTLAKECYCYMFNGCTGLTATPILPAKVIANDAYKEMFRNCSNLRTVTCYAKEKANTSATDNWLYGTATLGVLTFNAKYSHAWVNSDNTITRNVSSIPDGWDIAYIEEDVEDNSDITILNIPSIGYTGSPVEPTITVKDYNRVIPRGSDVEYTVTYYGVGSTDYVESSTTPTNAGSYRAMLTFQNDYSGVKEKAFTITKATPTVTAPTAITGLVYTGSAQTLINAGTAEGGELQYKVDDGAYSTDLPQATAIGNHTVYYKVVGDQNHNNVAEASFVVTIKMTVYVKKIGTSVHDPYTVEPTTTVSELKQLIATANSLEAEMINLIFAGHSLENGRPLSDYTISHESVIQMAAGRSMTANEDTQHPGTFYTTFYDSALRFVLPEGAEAYVATLSGDALIMTKIAEEDDVLPENTAVIIKAEDASLTMVVTTEEAVTFTATNNLHGVDAPTAAPANCYVLSGHSSDNSVTGVGFYQYTGTLKAHKAYATISGGAAYAPKKLRFVFNAATGVTNVQRDNVQCTKVIENGVLYIIKNGVRYNAQGQVVK